MIGGWKNVRRNRGTLSGARGLKKTIVAKGDVVPIISTMGTGNVNNKNINLYRYIRFVTGLELLQLKPHINCEAKLIPIDEICKDVLDNVEDDVKYLIETAVDQSMFDRNLIDLEVN